MRSGTQSSVGAAYSSARYMPLQPELTIEKQIAVPRADALGYKYFAPNGAYLAGRILSQRDEIEQVSFVKFNSKRLKQRNIFLAEGLLFMVRFLVHNVCDDAV